jgi:WD40 repeat protein/DNA-binding SARP family transcriptional activator
MDGEEVSGFDSDKVRALLAYLAVECDRPVRREKLAGLLWPDFAESSARTNLRQALANLRRVLRDQETEPPFLLPTRQTIQFNTHSHHTIDIHNFTVLARSEQRRSPLVEDLDQAVALYQGEFMQGFSLPDAAPFEAWTLVTRESLQRQILRALHRLAGFYEAQSAYEQALRFAYRQVTIDPYQEAAHQQILRLLAQSGQRNEALSHYEDYRQILKTELGVAPLDQTQAMCEQLQAGELPGPAAATVIFRREPRDVGDTPYRGLSAFREEDSPFFFGREEFTARLAEAVQSRTLVSVIVGPSGSGKSSTVFSGLLPQLRAQDDWLIMQCRPRSQPFQALAAGLVPFLAPELSKTDQLIEAEKMADALEEGSLSLYNAVLQALETQAEYQRCLFVIDQFEELYTLCPEPDVRRRFIDVLLAASEAGTQQRLPILVFVITLRADFVSQALAHRPFADALQDSALILGPMNRDELRAAIEKPAEKQGAAFESGLVGRILDDVREEPGNLPLLEFALTLLWERLDQGWLTHQAYEDIGRVEGALARYADEAYAVLTSDEKNQTRKALIQLVQPGDGTEDTRRVASRDEFDEETWALIRHLADKRLVVTGSDEAGTETAEVVHEALIRGWTRLQGWMAADRAFRLWQERLRTAIRGWEESGRDDGALLRGAPLTEAENWQSGRMDELSQLELEFIQASLAERNRAAEAERAQQARERALEQAALRRLRIIVGVLIAATMMGIVLTIGIFNQSSITRRTADENVIIANTAQAASTQALAQQEIAEMEANARATQQAIAEDEADARATQQTIAEGEAAARATQQIVAERNEAQARSLALAASARLALNAGEVDLAIALAVEANALPDPPAQTQLALADVAYSPGTRALLEGHAANRVYSISFSPDAKRALSGALDRTMILWDLQSATPLKHFGGFRGSVLNVHYLPSGDKALISNLDGSVRLLDLETGSELWRFLLQPPFIGAKLSPDRQMALWVNDAGHLIYIDLQGVSILREFIRGADEDYALAVSALAHHPTQALVMTGHVDGQLILWDLESGLEVRQFSGKPAVVEELAFTPDGQTILCADANGVVTAWDVRSGEILWVYEPGKIDERVFRLAVLPDNDWAVLGTLAGDLILWDLTTGKEVGRFGKVNSQYGHSGWISALVVSDDGKTVLSGGTGGKLIVWDLEAGAIKRSIEGIESKAVGTPLLSLAITTDKQNALAGYENGVIVLWDLESGERLNNYTEGIWNIESIAFGEGGRSAIAVTIDGFLSRWDMDSGEFIPLFERAPAGFVSTALSKDGQTLISAGRPQVISPSSPPIGSIQTEDIFVLDVERGRAIQQLSGGHDGVVTSLALSPDVRWALSGDDEGSITLWDLQETGDIITQVSHVDFVLDLAFTPDGTRALSSANDNGIILWDIPSGQILRRYPIVLNAENITISPDGQRIFAGNSSGKIQVLDLDTGQEIDLYAGHTNVVWDFELARDTSLALSSSEDGDVRLWDFTTGPSVGGLNWPDRQFAAALSPDGKCALTSTGGDLLYWDMENVEVILRLSGHDEPVFDVVFSPDGQRAVSTSGDPFALDPASMIYWDLEKGEPIRRLDWEDQLYHVAITPDGRYAVTSGNITPQSPTVFIWDLISGEVIDRFQTGPESLTVAGVALSPDGKLVIGGLLDDPFQRDWVRLWDFETGEMLASFVGHEFSVLELAFLPDGKKAISVSWDRSLILWDIENGELLQRMTGQNADLFSVAVDPTGRYALAGSGEGQLILWDLETGETIRTYQGHNGPVVHIAFSPEGDLAMTSAFDGSVRLWRINRTIEELVQWVEQNRFVRELTCEERALYQVDPLCD